MSCCWRGKGSDDDDPVPAESDHNRAEELRQQLSGMIPPIDVDWASDATVNMSGLSATSGSGQGRPAGPRLGTFERRHSMQTDPARVASGGVQLEWTDSRKLLEAAIAIEQLQPMPSIPESRSGGTGRGWGWGWGWEEDWTTMQEAEERLNMRLSKLKLEHCVMEGDGNCQFRAISFCLYGTQRHHAYVRRHAVGYMREHPAEFAAFLGEEWGDYIAQMSRDGTWGDELTLRAICEALATVVNVICSDEANWFLRYIPRSTRPQHECFLTYIAPLHYNAVRRRNTGDLLRHTFGRQGSELTRAVSTYRKNFGIPEQPHHVAAAGGLSVG